MFPRKKHSIKNSWIFKISDYFKTKSLLKQKLIEEKEFCKKFFLEFVEIKKLHHYSKFTDNGPSSAERVIRAIHNLFQKLVFWSRSSNWLSEIPSGIKKYHNTINDFWKMTPIDASKKLKRVFSNHSDKRKKHVAKNQLGKLIRWKCTQWRRHYKSELRIIYKIRNITRYNSIISNYLSNREKHW